MRPGGTTFWIALTPAMTIPLLGSLCYFVWFSGGAPARMLYAATKVFTLVWPLVCVFLLFRSRVSWPDLRWRRHLGAVPVGLALGALIAAAMLALMTTPMGDIVRSASPAIRAKAESLGVLKYYWEFALFLSLLHSLIEEYYWRWFVYGQLRGRMRPGPALALASAAFASHHVVIASQFFPPPWAWWFGTAVGVGGAVWCVMYERQRTLAGAWACHLVADLGIMYVGYTLIKVR